MAKSKYMYRGWRRGVSAFFYITSLLILMVSIERLVFDVFGQMWGTMLVNGMNLICTMTGLLGACIRERIAMVVYIVWSIISIGLNIVIVLTYQDIGLLSQKEHYLGLTLGNDNWWRTHGVSCSDEPLTNSTLLTNDTVEGSGDSPAGTCILTYATIETVHAAAYMFLTVFSVILILPLLCSWEEKTQQQSPTHCDNDEDFSFVNIAQWHDYPNGRGNKWQYSLGTGKMRRV